MSQPKAWARLTCDANDFAQHALRLILRNVLRTECIVRVCVHSQRACAVTSLATSVPLAARLSWENLVLIQTSYTGCSSTLQRLRGALLCHCGAG